MLFAESESSSDGDEDDVDDDDNDDGDDAYQYKTRVIHNSRQSYMCLQLNIVKGTIHANTQLYVSTFARLNPPSFLKHKKEILASMVWTTKRLCHFENKVEMW